MSSNVDHKEDGQRVQHAVSSRQAPSPHLRPVMVPNRLFTTHLDCIIKDKTRVKKDPQKSPGFSKFDGMVVREALAEPEHSRPSQRPPDNIDDLHEKEEFCDLEGDQTAIPKKFGVDETIQVTIERNYLELSPVSPVPDIASQNSISDICDVHEDTYPNIQSSEDRDYDEGIDAMNNNESLKKCPQKSSRKSRKDSESHSKEQSHKCEKKISSGMRSYTDHKDSHRHLDASRERSVTPKREKSLQRHKYSHASRERSVTPKREKSLQRNKYSHASRERSQKREKSSSQRRKCQASPEYARSSHRRTVKREMERADISPHVNAFNSTHGSSYSPYSGDADSHGQSLSYNKNVKHLDHRHQACSPHPHCSEVKPFQKMSSSETCVSVPESEDEQIIKQTILKVADRDLYRSCSSMSCHGDCTHSESSAIQHSSPSFSTCDNNSSPRPDTVYRIPTPTMPSGSWSSPCVSNHNISTMFPPTYYANTSPPLMVHGQFQWHVYSNAPVPSPSPNNPVLLSSPCNVEKRFQRLQNLHDPPKPSFHGYQLIGDSLLLRFSQQILNESSISAESLRFLGLCVSGQKIGELLKRLKNGFYHLGKKVVVMIGTNDLLQNTNSQQMCGELQKVVDYLLAKTEEVILLTLPPIPRLENTTYHWRRLETYNTFMRDLGKKDSKISVMDISPLYVLTQEELRAEELMAEYNAKTLFCHGCLTCMEESEDYDQDYSSQSDEDDIADTALLSRTHISTSHHINTVDISGLFMDRRIPKSRRECFEMFYSDSGRKDLIHLNLKGLQVVKDQLYKVL